jgi:ABC-type multidrug transport system fused ATPase/permease subunit
MDILFSVFIFLLILLSVFSLVRFLSNSIRRQNSQRSELNILNQKMDEVLENQRKMMEK